MNDAPLTSRTLLDDPDALIRVRDVLAILEGDYEIGKAVAAHHGFLKDGPAVERDPIEIARWIAWILCRGEREMIRRRDGEEAVKDHASIVYPLEDAPKVPLRDRLLKFIEQADDLRAREARGHVADED